MEKEGSSYGLKMKAYKDAADLVNVTEKTIRNWVADFELTTIVRKSKRGKHSKTLSPIVDNPDFKLKFKEYVKASSRRQGVYTVCFKRLSPLISIPHYKDIMILTVKVCILIRGPSVYGISCLMHARKALLA